MSVYIPTLGTILVAIFTAVFGIYSYQRQKRVDRDNYVAQNRLALLFAALLLLCTSCGSGSQSASDARSGGSASPDSYTAASGGSNSAGAEGGETTIVEGSAQEEQYVFEELPEAPSAEVGDTIEAQVVAEDASSSTQFDPQTASALSDQSASATASLTFDQFMRFVAGDINQFWANTYSQAQGAYSSPLVVLAYEPVNIENAPGCGETFDPGNNGPGPLYCPENSTIYYPANWLVPTTGLPLDQHGDFALAYVMAHEWGHHLQNIAGLTSEQYSNPNGKELQADCLAGVWANSTYYEGQLEPGDFEEAMTLAAALGDDTLGVPAGQGTHGSAADRQIWFKYGYDSGDGSRCVVQ